MYNKNIVLSEARLHVCYLCWYVYSRYCTLRGIVRGRCRVLRYEYIPKSACGMVESLYNTAVATTKEKLTLHLGLPPSRVALILLKGRYQGRY